MNQKKIRVGVIGASPERSWAARTHIPALRALPEFELTAVGTSREDSAHRSILPIGLRRRARAAIEEGLESQLRGLQQEAGVREQL